MGEVQRVNSFAEIYICIIPVYETKIETEQASKSVCVCCEEDVSELNTQTPSDEIKQTNEKDMKATEAE